MMEKINQSPLKERGSVLDLLEGAITAKERPTKRNPPRFPSRSAGLNFSSANLREINQDDNGGSKVIHSRSAGHVDDIAPANISEPSALGSEIDGEELSRTSSLIVETDDAAYHKVSLCHQARGVPVELHALKFS